MTFKVGDSVKIIRTETNAWLGTKVFNTNYTKVISPRIDFIRRVRYELTETGFIDHNDVEWVCCEEWNIPKDSLRLLTKLEKIL